MSSSPGVKIELLRLTLIRGRFRMRRLYERIRSPRRMLATFLCVGFILLFLINGFFVLANRQSADPQHLRLWLSGGMVLYAVYHLVRAAWGREICDLELSDAETLWLGGAPLSRSLLTVYHLIEILPATILKTCFLLVMLGGDVARIELLAVAVFTAFLQLEVVRLILARWVSSVGPKILNVIRAGSAAIAGGLVVHLFFVVSTQVPIGSTAIRYLLSSIHAIGETASLPIVQLAAIPWHPSAMLALSTNYHPDTMGWLILSVCMLPAMIWFLVLVDRLAIVSAHRAEVCLLAENGTMLRLKKRSRFSLKLTETHRFDWLRDRLPVWMGDAMPMLARQAVSIRRYAKTIIFSFSIPIALSLSPLITLQADQKWLFVIGGIAMCTMLLAPPALRLDFRRDLRRMTLLRSLPIRPITLVVGQVSGPVLITIVFQLVTLGIAAAFVGPSLQQIMLWSGTLTGLAVITFALENGLFLLFPHHEKAQGIGMMLRAKLAFLGKTALLLGALTALYFWATLCQSSILPSYRSVVFVGGAVAVSWFAAIVSVVLCAHLWSRFEPSADVPPQ